MPKFDKYTFFARLVPAIIAAAPALTLAWVLISWKSLGVTHAIAGTALTVLLMVFADVARRRGKHIEPGINERMGGLPSTTILRHRDPTFDEPTRMRMHAALATRLNEQAPTAAQEAADPAAADSFYTRAATWLRENTRDKKHFEILFNENVTYGYRRNLYALKWPALALNVAIVFGCITAYRYKLIPHDLTGLAPVFVIAFLHASYLALFSSEEAVREASRTYARQLLLSTESPHLPKTGTAPRSRTKKASG
ncbi:hypothetical protein QRQ56_26420 [Bradyrhizobium sp. U531]|uniref:hypothetical protein n=1 Tax=Bradyrhizobium TaxID=374 RepID=UPI000A1908FE|nr:hypothetical protein [Bradyrhizobium canariense]OSI73821.1 hypothetical protein BSZ21_06450 [Bradyrhizobium canariense]